jgi:dinuclear metal center YbgI/SA1388 family protein
MPVSFAEIASYTDELLDSKNTPDYANALNGVQLEHRGPVRGIAAAVDFSTAAIRGTIEQNANLLIVHHGMFWSGSQRLQEAALHRMRLLLDNDIAVYSSHLPLDRHAILGNNVLLAEEFGLAVGRPFANHYGVSIGVAGDADLETAELAERVQEFSQSHGGSLRTSRIATRRRTHRWGICSGAGASVDILNEAVNSGVDTLIVGEGPHWTAVFAEEHNLAILYAGHYATETVGVRALARHLGEKFNLPWSFVAAPTGL